MSIGCLFSTTSALVDPISFFSGRGGNGRVGRPNICLSLLSRSRKSLYRLATFHVLPLAPLIWNTYSVCPGTGGRTVGEAELSGRVFGTRPYAGARGSGSGGAGGWGEHLSPGGRPQSTFAPSIAAPCPAEHKPADEGMRLGYRDDASRGAGGGRPMPKR